MGPMLKIDFLFWKECPSHPIAWERLNEALTQMGLRAKIQRIEVKTDEEAETFCFPGSPTIRVNGKDIDPEGVCNQPVRLTCRIYYDAGGRVIPVPPLELIKQALKNAQAQGGPT
jgi:hypothetical protein